MDLFAEQLIKIKNSTIEYILMALIVLVALAGSVVLFIYSGAYPILILGVVALIFGAYKLLGRFQREYEYIHTNGTVDIDRILAKSSRLRMLSFDTADIIGISRYNPNEKNPNITAKYVYANPQNAYGLIIKKGGGRIMLVAELSDKMLESIKESMPRQQQYIFKEL